MAPVEPVENNGAHRADVPDPIISGPLYDKLKFVALILLPGLAVLYVALAALWDWSNADKVSGSIMAVDTFLGLFLGQTSKQFKKVTVAKEAKRAVEDAKIGGVLSSATVDPDTGIPHLKLDITAPLEDVLGQDTVKLKVDNKLPPSTLG